MLVRLDAASDLPLNEQLAAALRAAIAGGEARPGERLPAARVLARQLDVNVHTVLRSYARLREEGLIELRRGRGAVVRADATAGTAALHELAGRLVAEGRRQGLGLDDLKDLLERTAR